MHPCVTADNKNATLSLRDPVEGGNRYDPPVGRPADALPA